MTGKERCDEILRLIDQALGDNVALPTPKTPLQSGELDFDKKHYEGPAVLLGEPSMDTKLITPDTTIPASKELIVVGHTAAINAQVSLGI